jgi:uncharacterized protein
MAFPEPVSHRRISRRRFLTATMGAAAGLALYSGEIERHWIEITRRVIHLSRLPAALDGLRIAQLSDIHMDEYTEPFFLRHAVDEINRLSPDAVVLTGDYVTKGPFTQRFFSGSAWQCANILKGLKCEHIFACLGNHDLMAGAAYVTRALKDNGIPVLRNSYLPIERQGARLWLAGLDDPVEGKPDPELAIPVSIRDRGEEPVVVLCHAPDYADSLRTHAAGNAVDLMLSGHTHGGQIRVPLLGAFHLPTLGRKYVEGLFRFGGMQLYVNRGLGTVEIPFRFDCPPEITLITLRSGALRNP